MQSVSVVEEDSSLRTWEHLHFHIPHKEMPAIVEKMGYRGVDGIVVN